MPQSNGHRDQRRASTGDDAAPVEALIQAMLEHNGIGMLGLLAPDVRLSVPPLRIHVEGAQQVTGSILDVVDAFDALTYRVRSRYLAPGQVTDEGVLGGVHVRALLGAPPTGRLGSVSVRVIAVHDGRQVTGLDVWPDVAAVRGLCEELARHIDQRHAGSAGAMVTALRASIPDAAPRVVRSSAREAPTPPTPMAVEAIALGRNVRSPGRTEGLKSPVTRRVRRRRAITAGALMLASSTALIAWVAHGALQPGAVTTALITTTPRSTLDAASRVAVAPSVTKSAAAPVPATPTPSPQPFDIDVQNQVVIPSDLLFATDSSKLTDAAMADVQAFIATLIEQKRRGRIDVMGYTDDKGSTSYNLRLSKARAKAVADALRAGLDTTGWTVYFKGLGEADPKAKGTSEAARALNRRVEIQVPPSQQ